MTRQEKVKLIEDMLELDEGTLCEEMLLKEIDEWDSMAALSLIVLMDEKFNKELTSDQIKSFKSVRDIINFME